MFYFLRARMSRVRVFFSFSSPLLSTYLFRQLWQQIFSKLSKRFSTSMLTSAGEVGSWLAYTFCRLWQQMKLLSLLKLMNRLSLFCRRVGLGIASGMFCSATDVTIFRRDIFLFFSISYKSWGVFLSTCSDCPREWKVLFCRSSSLLRMSNVTLRFCFLGTFKMRRILASQALRSTFCLPALGVCDLRVMHSALRVWLPSGAVTDSGWVSSVLYLSGTGWVRRD